MERMTYRLEDQYGNYICMGTPKKLEVVLSRLAAYEETGLEPEEIQAIAGLASENCAKTADAIDKLLQDDAELKSYRELGPIDRLREFVQADLEGRCVVLPCKIFDKVWNIDKHYQFEVTEIDLLPYGNILFRCGNKGTDDYAAFYGDDLGDTFTFEEPQERDNCVVKEAALRREQDD